MVAVSMGLIIVGYSIGLWGYILLKGYNISFKDLFTLKDWPPFQTKAPA